MKSTKKVITDWENVPLYMDYRMYQCYLAFRLNVLRKKHKRVFSRPKKCTVNGVSQKKTQKNIMIHYKEA